MHGITGPIRCRGFGCGAGASFLVQGVLYRQAKADPRGAEVKNRMNEFMRSALIGCLPARRARAGGRAPAGRTIRRGGHLRGALYAGRGDRPVRRACSGRKLEQRLGAAPS